ncbi:calcium/calmodulin-dependent protein kinase [Achlya hypogyna]|uniref:Calcium/calmodulin-dependent protein kinase n=1 Tax=Achlya hypogyna TaxID=1202772 RepID=A0A1V9YB44_ACHHY|nr:calcium/calmodulin-dependent protein kinase [Achlya hypogyna]
MGAGKSTLCCCARGPRPAAENEKAHEATVATDGPLEDSDDLSTPPQSPRPDDDSLSPAIQSRPSLVSSHHFADIYAMDPEAKLGEGATATVYVATHKKHGKRVAVKCFDKAKMAQNEIRDLFTEVGILKLMKHPHILQLHDFFEEPTHFYIVTDLLEGGELFDRIIEKEYYSEKEARDLVKLLLQALQYLHDLNIVHRDLKPENVLLMSRGDDTSIKIADFGFAKMDFEGKLTDKCGSPEYIAPEILSRSYYGKQVDIWSAGVITYILLCGYPPFSGRNNTVLFNNIKAGAFQFESPYWDDVSAEAKAFVSKMLVVDPSARASVDELLNDVWITGEVSSAPLNGVMDELRRFNARRKFKAAVKTVRATVSLLNDARARSASAPMTPPAQEPTDDEDMDEKETRPSVATTVMARMDDSNDDPSPGFFRENYTLGGVLGEGSYAIVKKARSHASGQLCAVKIFKKESLSEQDDADVLTEVRILRKLDHPNVLRLLDFYSEPKYYYLVTEYVEGGELFERIALMEYYSEKEARELVKTLLEAIGYCHSLGVVHRDLKPENILLTSKADNSAIKIADFGFAKQDTNGLSTTCGSPEYVAPEIISRPDETYGSAVDIWSIGVITYVLLAGYTPFHDPNQNILFDNICNGRFYFYEPDWNEVSQEAKDFVSRALELDPKKRPSAKELLKDPWLTGLNVSDRNLTGVIEKLPTFNQTRRKFRAAVQATMLVNSLKAGQTAL